MGPASSGKTELAIDPITYLSKENKCGRQESKISRNSLLSGYGDNEGILAKLPGAKLTGRLIKSNGILTFPDFSTAISGKPEDVKVIMSDLRRIYDGSFDMTVGNRALQWEGKVTIVAASTSKIEEYFILHRDLGERWLSIKWKGSEKKKEAMQRSHAQIDHKIEIKAGYHKRLKELMRHCLNTVKVDPKVFSITDSLALFTEALRVTITRDYSLRNQPVRDIDEEQHPMRISKNLVCIARASAAIRCNTEVDDFDLSLAKRVCLESVPSKRMLILRQLMDVYPDPLVKKELVYKLHCHGHKVPQITIDRTIEELRYLNIIESYSNNLEEKLGDGLTLPSFDDPGSYAPETLYAIKNPKSGDLLGISTRGVNLLADSNLI